MWIVLAAPGCGHPVSTHKDTTTPTDGDADTDADSDSDTDADTDSGSSGGHPTDSGTPPTSGFVDGGWGGSCLPTNPFGFISSIDVDVTLTQTGTDVTGSGQVTYHIDFGPPPGGSGYSGYTVYTTTTGYTYTFPGGSGYSGYTFPGGSGVGYTGYTFPGGSFYYSGSYGSSYYTGSYGGWTTTGSTFGEEFAVSVKGQWDLATSRLQTGIDVGYPNGQNPRIDGTVATDEWTGEWSWPSGYPLPYECTLDRQ